MNYAEFEDSEYCGLRRDLIREKGSPLQKKFLEQLRRGGEEFCSWMRERLKVTAGKKLDLSENKLTEDEFKGDITRAVFERWDALEPAVACRSSFWAYISFRHVEEGKIKADYLAGNSGGIKGATRIDHALQVGSDEEGRKTMDRVVRTALRNLGGLPDVRGNRSVYADCPFGRGWWRRKWAAEVGAEAGRKPDDIKDIERLLRLKQAYWEKLVDLVISTNSVMGDTKVRTALILFLAEQHTNKIKRKKCIEKVLVADKLPDIRRQIGIRMAYQELGVFQLKELQKLLADDITRLFPA